jgi:cell division protein FtsL
MTIIEPHRAKYSYNSAVLYMLLALVALACLSIYFYNESVDIRHSISANAKDLQSLQVSNAELKSQLYATMDLSNLDAIAKSENLVKETKPGYIETTSGVLAVN